MSEINCPSCGTLVEQFSPPKRGPVSDRSQAWVCLKCPAVICVECYSDHTATKHAEMYSPRKKKR